MATRTRKQRRAQERRWTVGVLVLVAIALVGSIGMWVAFFKVWTPTTKAPSFALPSSTGRTIALEDFRGRQEVVLVFYMVAT